MTNKDCPVCDGEGHFIAAPPCIGESLLAYLLRACDEPRADDDVSVTCDHQTPKLRLLATLYDRRLEEAATPYPVLSDDVHLDGQDEPYSILCRPPPELAGLAVRSFVTDKLGRDDFPLTIIRDGDDGYAFWVLSEDGTSYLHDDLRIEWYGTDWDGWGDEDDEAPKGEEVTVG